MQRVLAQYHATSAHETCENEENAEPPQRVEAEYLGEGKHATRYATDSCSVYRYLPPHIYDGANNLYHQCRHHYATHEMREMQVVHEVETGEIADDGDDVWHHSSFAGDEFQHRPSLIFPVEMDDHRRQEDGENIYDKQHRQLITPRQQVEITEQE